MNEKVDIKILYKTDQISLRALPRRSLIGFVQSHIGIPVYLLVQSADAVLLTFTAIDIIMSHSHSATPRRSHC